MKEDYYKAYEKRYSQVHQTGKLWEIHKSSREVIDTINEYNITKDDKILDLGCGEGRDAIYLLDNGYNVLAVDYSTSAIQKCNELTENKYKNNFKQFDLITDNIDEKFDFIYSIAVIHMVVNEKHRQKFYQFIYNHLKENGKALVIAMGDGKKEYSSDVNNAFLNSERININNNKKVLVANTSCKIKNMAGMIKEIKKGNLRIIKNEIINDLPGFAECESFILQINNQNLN